MASALATGARRTLMSAANIVGKMRSGSGLRQALITRSNHGSHFGMTRGTRIIGCSIAQFSTTPVTKYAKRGRPGPGEGVTVNFVMQDGEEISVQAHKGESLLDVAWANDIDIEGACDASLSCSTCHLILDPESYSKLEEPTDEENDMLDLAFGLTDTSRLGCQVLMNEELNGIVAKLPAMTRNASAV